MSINLYYQLQYTVNLIICQVFSPKLRNRESIGGKYAGGLAGNRIRLKKGKFPLPGNSQDKASMPVLMHLKLQGFDLSAGFPAPLEWLFPVLSQNKIPEA